MMGMSGGGRLPHTLVAAQQSVHRTAGSRRVFGLLSELWQFSVSESYPPQPPVTRAVRQLSPA